MGSKPHLRRGSVKMESGDSQDVHRVQSSPPLKISEIVLASVPSILDEKTESQSVIFNTPARTDNRQRQAHLNAKSKELLRENIHEHFQ